MIKNRVTPRHCRSNKVQSSKSSENTIVAIMMIALYIENILVESMSGSNLYLEMDKSQQKKEIDRRMGLYRA